MSVTQILSGLAGHVDLSMRNLPEPAFIAQLDEETLTFRKVAEIGRATTPTTSPWVALERIRDMHGPGGVVTIHDLTEDLTISRRSVYRLIETPEFVAWMADGTLEVTATGNRGGPTAWRFIGPTPERGGS